MSNHKDSKPGDANGKPTVTLAGTVQKIVNHGEPEKAEIIIDEADDLYREIRIPNVLEDSEGKEVKLKQGTEVNVVIQAPPEGVEKKT
jgi:hypothetical protein